MIQREVAEQILHDKGLSRQDIHGVERDTVALRKRYDITATLRRACAACGRRRLVRALSVAAIANGVVAAATASYGAAIVTAALTVVAVAAHRAPDDVFEAPDPAFELGRIEGDGLTDREVMRRFAIVNERERYKKERIEAETDAKEQGRPTVSRL